MRAAMCGAWLCVGCADNAVVPPVVPPDGPDLGTQNQTFDPTIGLDALGPAIVLAPAVELPGGAECVLRITLTVTDRDGNPLLWPGAEVWFRTASE